MKLLGGNMEFDVRPATIDDVPLLLAFFSAMAEFEKLTVTATEESIRASLFGGAPAATALLAFVGDKPAAYAIYFFTFSTMVGKRGLWLEDLFVDPAFRGHGLGRALMAHLAEVAMKHDCGRFEWIVLDWNDAAMRFYERLGATRLDNWRICRVDETQLPRLARGRET